MSKSKEEIAASIATCQKKARARQAEITARANESKAVISKLKDLGFRMEYKFDYGELISVASRWNKKSKRMNIVFAVKSPKDKFTRLGARRAILRHLDEDTHAFSFPCKKPDFREIRENIISGIRWRMVSRPWEFPKQTLWDTIYFRS